MKKAWIENNTVRDIAQGNPSDIFHADIAAHYDTDVDDTVTVGASLVSGVWVNPVVVVPVAPVVTLPKLSPIEFKMCFTSSERIAIKTLMTTDAIVADAFSILEDARLKEVDLAKKSNQDLIDYLVSKTVLTADRAVEVKAGVML